MKYDFHPNSLTGPVGDGEQITVHRYTGIVSLVLRTGIVNHIGRVEIDCDDDELWERARRAAGRPSSEACPWDAWKAAR
jgi:hypothetical protein